MGVAHLLDHRARLWRESEAASGSLRSVVQSYANRGTLAVGVRRPSASLGDPGPGLTPVGARVIYAEPGHDIRLRDIIELLSGPDAPGRFEVDEPPTRPRGHHLEISGRFWPGKLPGDA